MWNLTVQVIPSVDLNVRAVSSTYASEERTLILSLGNLLKNSNSFLSTKKPGTLPKYEGIPVKIEFNNFLHCKLFFLRHLNVEFDKFIDFINLLF